MAQISNPFSELGHLLKGNEKKNVRKEDIEPIKRVFTFVLFSVALSKKISHIVLEIVEPK